MPASQANIQTPPDTVASLKSDRKVQRGLLTRNFNKLDALLNDFNNQPDKQIAYDEIQDIYHVITQRRSKLQDIDTQLHGQMITEKVDEGDREKDVEEASEHLDELLMKANRFQRRIDAIAPQMQAPVIAATQRSS